jgi:hypothetical protein
VQPAFQPHHIDAPQASLIESATKKTRQQSHFKSKVQVASVKKNLAATELPATRQSSCHP